MAEKYPRASVVSVSLKYLAVVVKLEWPVRSLSTRLLMFAFSIRVAECAAACEH